MENNKYHDYENKPLKFLWDTRSELLPAYLWTVWLVIGATLLIGIFLNIININTIEVVGYVDLSVSGLSFTLVIISAAFEVYNKDELTILLENRGEKNGRKGLALLETLTPYIFTAFLYLIIGLISVITPLLQIQVPNIVAVILNLIFIMLLILGLFSLFNVTYTLLNSLYYSVIRHKYVIEIENKKINIERKMESKVESYKELRQEYIDNGENTELIDNKIKKCEQYIDKLNQ